MNRPLHKESVNWKGEVHELELYETDTAEGLNPVKQVQAVPFLDNDHIVLYKHVDGYYGLPGGSVEEGERFEETLKREVTEETACEVLDYGLFGYIQDRQVEPRGHEKYQLRYWAKVKALNESINDPDGKATFREIVSVDEAVEKLHWGKLGTVLIELAVEKFRQTHA